MPLPFNLLQLTSGFNEYQRSYFDKLKKQAEDLRQGRDNEQLKKEKDLDTLRALKKVEKALIEFLKTREVAEIGKYGRHELRLEEVEFFEELEAAIFAFDTPVSRDAIRAEIESAIINVRDYSCRGLIFPRAALLMLEQLPYSSINMSKIVVKFI